MTVNKIYTLLAEAEDPSFERLQEIVTLIAEIAGVNNSSFEEAAETSRTS